VLAGRVCENMYLDEPTEVVVVLVCGVLFSVRHCRRVDVRVGNVPVRIDRQQPRFPVYRGVNCLPDLLGCIGVKATEGAGGTHRHVGWLSLSRFRDSVVPGRFFNEALCRVS
jgi:hypothetical protein